MENLSAKELWGCLSVVLGITAYATYIWDIFKNDTRPHAFSWVIWGTVMAIIFCAQIAKQGGAGAWAIGVSSAFCYSIAGLAAWRGEKVITRSDWLTFIGALLAIPIWILTKDPLWSVILVTAIDAVAYYPTFRKSYIQPHRESTFMYALDNIKCAISIIALEHYSLTALFYPVMGIIFNTIFITTLFARRRVRPV